MALLGRNPWKMTPGSESAEAQRQVQAFPGRGCLPPWDLRVLPCPCHGRLTPRLQHAASWADGSFSALDGLSIFICKCEIRNTGAGQTSIIASSVPPPDSPPGDQQDVDSYRRSNN